MISVDNQDNRAGGIMFEFKGLSTDTKPTGTYNGANILNGSTYIAMDTLKVYFYDEESSDWVGGV